MDHDSPQTGQRRAGGPLQPRHFGFDPSGRSAIVFGAGGAGAAIATALLDAGLAQLGLHDLGDRAQQLVERLHPHAGTARVEAVGAAPEGLDLVVNATPLGLRHDALVVDILMKQAPTALLRECRTRGIEAHPGFEMLVQQVPDYLDFFGLHEAAKAVQADLSEVRKLLHGSSEAARPSIDKRRHVMKFTFRTLLAAAFASGALLAGGCWTSCASAAWSAWPTGTSGSAKCTPSRSPSPRPTTSRA